MTTGTHIRVSKETREKLNELRTVLSKENVNDVIISLMISRQYNNAFFERRRAEHFMKVGK